MVAGFNGGIKSLEASGQMQWAEEQKQQCQNKCLRQLVSWQALQHLMIANRFKASTFPFGARRSCTSHRFTAHEKSDSPPLPSRLRRDPAVMASHSSSNADETRVIPMQRGPCLRRCGRHSRRRPDATGPRTSSDREDSCLDHAWRLRHRQCGPRRLFRILRGIVTSANLTQSSSHRCCLGNGGASRSNISGSCRLA